MFEPVLVADIGGTNARFAIATHFDKHTKQFELEHIKKLSSSAFDNFSEVVKAYLGSIPTFPKRACFAVAGPRKGDIVYLTNLGWQFDINDIQAEFDFCNFNVINDFAAFAHAAPYIKSDINTLIKSGNTNPDGNIAVIGPGTGFGAAALVKGSQNVVLSCEAGHISLAPCNNLERELLAILSDDFEHVSIEHIFSGQGLENLYRAMAKFEGIEPKEYDAPTITDLALNNIDKVCVKTLNQFCDWIGAVAGDLALTFNATGGVFIGGGILPRFEHILLSSDFVKRFTAKGKMHHLVLDIPVTLITQDNIPLLGATACMELD